MSLEISVVTPETDDGPGPLAGTDVVFLPIAEDGGTPVYPGTVLPLVEELAAAGVSARTWHDAESSEILSDRGPVVDALLEIVVGIATSGGWYAIQSLLRRRGGQVHVIAVYEQDGRRRRAEVTGDADDVAEALERLDPFRPDPPA